MSFSTVITCPWCGTSYPEFRSNCANCGGPLPAPKISDTEPSQPAAEELGPAVKPPPLPPRTVPATYLKRILLADAAMVGMGIVAGIGAFFMFLGFTLTAVVVTAFVGIPFMLTGLAMFVGGGAIMLWRYGEAKAQVELVRSGQAVCGEVRQVYENVYVRINRRHPWTVEYSFNANGQTYTGKMSTLAWPGPEHHPGRPVWVIYDPANVEKNTLYPLF